MIKVKNQSFKSLSIYENNNNKKNRFNGINDFKPKIFDRLYKTLFSSVKIQNIVIIKINLSDNESKRNEKVIKCHKQMKRKVKRI